jgi:uncharacterized protein
MKRLALLAAAAFASLLVLAGPASAHVTVSAPGAAAGGSDQEITFRVPVEKDVPTVGLTVELPVQHPLAGVDVRPMPGWTHTEKTGRLMHPVKTDDGEITTGVLEISWRATGVGIAPGEYGSFTILAGQLPDAPSLTFKAVQYYKDGSVTRWVETAAPGSASQPENPAPVLRLAPVLQNELSHGSAPLEFVKTAQAPSNTGPVVLSIVALVVAALALGLAVVARARSRA